MCIFLFWMVHCRIWNKCIMGFVRLVYCEYTVRPIKLLNGFSFVVTSISHKTSILPNKIRVNVYVHSHNKRKFEWMLNTLRSRKKWPPFFQTTLSNAFSWLKMYEFRLRFHWSLFPRVQLTTIFQHWFKWWLGAGQATSHYLNQWWLIYCWLDVTRAMHAAGICYGWRAYCCYAVIVIVYSTYASLRPVLNIFSINC